MFTVKFEKRAEKDFSKLPLIMKKRVIQAIEALSSDPKPAGHKKLKGQTEELFRIRVGDYRIIYTINDGELIILVLTIDHRKDVYKSL